MLAQPKVQGREDNTHMTKEDYDDPEMIEWLHHRSIQGSLLGYRIRNQQQRDVRPRAHRERGAFQSTSSLGRWEGVDMAKRWEDSGTR